jgi:hypothetical protein
MTKKDLLKSIKDRLFEGEVTLQYFKDTNKPDVLIEEQERSINEIKEFIEYLKK